VSQRERSHWGWGWADRFPDADARRSLGQQVAFLLGASPPEPGEPVPLSEAALPAARLAAPPALTGFCTDDREARIRHTYGRGFRDLVRGFRGDFSPAPDLVALPREEAQIEALLAWAAGEGVAVVPYGGGTSVVGGVECDGAGRAGVVCLDLRAMDRVLEVDEVSRAARIQAGATGPGLEAQLKPRGLSLRHYPQSFEFSTVGGWIATRAGGHFATVYTHIDDLVQSVRMLTPAGVWQSRRLPASGAGPEPDRLVLGSEGALGVITEAWLRLQERPRWRSRASVHFDDFDRGVEAARRVAQAGLYPANCRVLDGTEALINQVAAGVGAVLVLGFESASGPREAWLEQALAIAAGCGGRCPDPPQHTGQTEGGPGGGGEERRGPEDAGERWRRAFLDGPYLQTSLVSLGLVADTFETACTWEGFPPLHAAVRRAVREAAGRGGGRAVISCRFTHVYPDGPAPYYTFLATAPDGRILERWQAIKEAASEALSTCGATITHHHAVGRLHRPWYSREIPAPFEAALRSCKQTLDPEGILNPGVLLEDSRSGCG
jgi:alkyldihydroxyacetonephosphate synthase